jgi:hypothetical protein
MLQMHLWGRLILGGTRGRARSRPGAVKLASSSALAVGVKTGRVPETGTGYGY